MLSKYVEYADTSAMLTKYLRKSDTSTLSNRINTKLNTSDSTIYYTKFRSDTSRTNIYNQLAQELNIADSTIYYTKFRSDTSRSNIYSSLSGKLTASDTSVFQRKSLSSYTFSANNTNATANATAQNFKDITGTYSGTITWTGTTAPSGATTHIYNFTQIGKMVILNISLSYATVGSALTEVVLALPSDCPTPKDPSGLSGNSFFQYPANTYFIGNTGTTMPSLASRSLLRKNSTGNGYEIDAQYISGPFRYVMTTVIYYTN